MTRWVPVLLLLGGCIPPQQAPVIVSPPNCYCIAPTRDTCEPGRSAEARDARADKKDRTEKVEKLKREVTKAKEQVERMKGTPIPTPTDDSGE